MILAVVTWRENQLDETKPTGDEYVSDIDLFIRQDRAWVKDCLSRISGYPTNTYLKMPKWENNAGRPSNPKEGFMGYKDSIKKFEYYTPSGWIPLEYNAYSCGVTDKDEEGWAKYAKRADKAIADGAGNNIGSTYLKISEVSNAKNKVPRFLSNGHLQFWDGSEFWVE